ncbi:MAG: SGNH/GDSL hydrolase family protein [Gemmatimonadetes bacterium]|nr:SGNH/GDSL hydrolase family protein [Gemmatimonadota bacterium]
MTNRTRALLVGAVAVLVACDANRDAVGLTNLNSDIFRSYVAIGNSITAGWQSGGINDSTQLQAYPRLLAIQMGTPYKYASLVNPGCPAPIANFQTQAKVGKATDPVCSLRNPASVTDVLNNVGVPDARVLDPISPSTVASNALTTFILGGKTQVQRALDARPSFVSIWIGANNVLQAAYTGILVPTPGVSNGIVGTQAEFQASYDSMIKQLLDSMPGLKGVLIGVPDASSIPLMSSGALLAASPQIQGAMTAIAGKPVVVDPNCTGSAALISTPLLLNMIKAGAIAPVVSCVAGSDPTDPRIGQIFVLDATERAQLSGFIAGLNAYIKAKAAAIGFAYWDPNPTLTGIRNSPQSLPFPNFQPTGTFGTAFSLDGVHPSAEGQKLIANNLITVINQTYGTALKPIP